MWIIYINYMIKVIIADMIYCFNFLGICGAWANEKHNLNKYIIMEMFQFFWYQMHFFESLVGMDMPLKYKRF